MMTAPLQNALRQKIIFLLYNVSRCAINRYSALLNILFFSGLLKNFDFILLSDVSIIKSYYLRSEFMFSTIVYTVFITALASFIIFLTYKFKLNPFYILIPASFIFGMIGGVSPQIPLPRFETVSVQQ